MRPSLFVTGAIAAAIGSVLLLGDALPAQAGASTAARPGIGLGQLVRSLGLSFLTIFGAALMLVARVQGWILQHQALVSGSR